MNLQIQKNRNCSSVFPNSLDAAAASYSFMWTSHHPLQSSPLQALSHLRRSGWDNKHDQNV